MEDGYIPLSIKKVTYIKRFKKYSSAIRYATKHGKKVEVLGHDCYLVTEI